MLAGEITLDFLFSRHWTGVVFFFYACLRGPLLCFSANANFPRAAKRSALRYGPRQRSKQQSGITRKKKAKGGVKKNTGRDCKNTSRKRPNWRGEILSFFLFSWLDFLVSIVCGRRRRRPQRNTATQGLAVLRRVRNTCSSFGHVYFKVRFETFLSHFCFRSHPCLFIIYCSSTHRENAGSQYKQEN